MSLWTISWSSSRVSVCVFVAFYFSHLNFSFLLLWSRVFALEEQSSDCCLQTDKHLTHIFVIVISTFCFFFHYY